MIKIKEGVQGNDILSPQTKFPCLVKDVDGDIFFVVGYFPDREDYYSAFCLTNNDLNSKFDSSWYWLKNQRLTIMKHPITIENDLP